MWCPRCASLPLCLCWGLIVSCQEANGDALHEILCSLVVTSGLCRVTQMVEMISMHSGGYKSESHDDFNPNPIFCSWQVRSRYHDLGYHLKDILQATQQHKSVADFDPGLLQEEQSDLFPVDGIAKLQNKMTRKYVQLSTARQKRRPQPLFPANADVVATNEHSTVGYIRSQGKIG